MSRASTSTTATVLIMAGGTGGHVYPALAVANSLRTAGARVVWMGVRQGLEARVVPAAGIPIEFVRVSGLRGRGVLGWLLAPLRLLWALAEALMIIRRLRPQAALGMGGFASGPGGFAAWLLGCPLLVHEQNAVPGFTNRILARLARRIMESFPGSFPGPGKTLHTGNPVRPEITAIEPPGSRLARRSGPLRLLVLGGSQGARKLNETVPRALAALPSSTPVEVRHQTGPAHLQATQALYDQLSLHVAASAYIEDMGQAYAWADLAVCRAGAMTIAELAAAGLAAVLVPFPHAVDDHQTRNAAYLVDQGAAVLLPEEQLEPSVLAKRLADLGHARDRLLSMASKARACALPEATADVVGLCLETANA